MARKRRKKKNRNKKKKKPQPADPPKSKVAEQKKIQFNDLIHFVTVKEPSMDVIARIMCAMPGRDEEWYSSWAPAPPPKPSPPPPITTSSTSSSYAASASNDLLSASIGSTAFQTVPAQTGQVVSSCMVPNYHPSVPKHKVFYTGNEQQHSPTKDAENEMLTEEEIAVYERKFMKLVEETANAEIAQLEKEARAIKALHDMGIVVPVFTHNPDFPTFKHTENIARSYAYYHLLHHPLSKPAFGNLLAMKGDSPRYRLA